MLLAVISDEVWLALIGAIVSISTILSTIVLAWIALKTKQSVEKSAADAAHHVEQVKVQLQQTTSANEEKLNALANTVDQTLERVNGGMKAQLEINATSARTLAVLLPEPAHEERARVADEALAAHMRTDEEVKANQSHAAYH